MDPAQRDPGLKHEARPGRHLPRHPAEPRRPLKVILGGRLAWYKADADTDTDTDSYKVSERIDTRLNFNNLFDKYCDNGIDFGSSTTAGRAT